MENHSQQMFDEALAAYKKKRVFHFTEMARDLGFPNTTLHYNMTRRRKWNADRWLMSMFYLGAAKFEGDKLIIKTKSGKNLKDLLKVI